VDICSLVLLCSIVEVGAVLEHYRVSIEMINELSIVNCTSIVFDSWMA
jgi:hypothetical protein